MSQQADIVQADIVQADIVIVGAGTLGAALALRLAQVTDFSIKVIERGPALDEASDPNQRVFALGQCAATLLEQIGVFKLLGSESCHPYQSMCVWDAGSAGQLNFSASEIEQTQLGWMVDAQKLTRLLQQELAKTARISVVYEHELTEFKRAADTAKVSSQTLSVTTPLAIAADGANSWLRRAAKIFSNRMPYGQAGIVARICTSEPHQHCAWQRFLDTGPVAVLPLANGDSSIVWSADQHYADQLMALCETDFEIALSKALDQRLGAVKLKTQRQCFPLVSQSASRYYQANVALIGDAAHSIHPLAGQGANLGFKDIELLAALLSEHSTEQLRQRSMLALLQRYQRGREKDNRQTDLLMTALYQTYKANNPLWASLRGLGMSLVDNTPVLRELLARQAMGL